MRLWFFLLGILCCLGLEAGSMESCYQRCLHKQGNHRVGGVDYIYMINLKKDLDKFRSFKTEFEKYSVKPYRYNALDSKNLSYKIARKIGVNGDTEYCETDAQYVKMFMKRNFILPKTVKPILVSGIMSYFDRTYFHQCMDLKSISRNLDYLSILYNAHKSKYNVIWIMDDTIKISEDPNKICSYLVALNNLDKKWDVLYTDPCENPDYQSMPERLKKFARPDVKLDFKKEDYVPLEDRDVYSSKIIPAGYRMHAYSVILSKKGIRKVLSYYHKHKFFIPFSIELPAIPKLKVYATADKIITYTNLKD